MPPSGNPRAATSAAAIAPRGHATHYANSSGHPIVRAQRSGEVWRWRYMDWVGMKIDGCRSVRIPHRSLRMTLKPSARWPQYAGPPGQEVASS